MKNVEKKVNSNWCCFQANTEEIELKQSDSSENIDKDAKLNGFSSISFDLPPNTMRKQESSKSIIENRRTLNRQDRMVLYDSIDELINTLEEIQKPNVKQYQTELSQVLSQSTIPRDNFNLAVSFSTVFCFKLIIFYFFNIDSHIFIDLICLATIIYLNYSILTEESEKFLLFHYRTLDIETKLSQDLLIKSKEIDEITSKFTNTLNTLKITKKQVSFSIQSTLEEEDIDSNSSSLEKSNSSLSDKERIEKENEIMKAKITELSVKNRLNYGEFKRLFDSVECYEHDNNVGTFRLNDETFLRFFKARKFNVDKSHNMLVKHIELRNKYLPFNIERDEFDAIMKKRFIFKYGYSFKKEPILLSKICNFDPSYFSDMEQYSRFCLYILEELVRTELSVVDGITRGIVVFDLKGLSLSKHWNAQARAQTKRFVHIVQDHNPERLTQILILNAPSIFTIIWRVITVFLDPVIKDKFVFITKNEQLLRYIPQEYLIEEHGGSKKEDLLKTF